MGIPAQKHIKPDSPPEGYEIRESGKVSKSDLIWSTSEHKYVPADEFFVEGEPVSTFWGVAKQKS